MKGKSFVTQYIFPLDVELLQLRDSFARGMTQKSSYREDFSCGSTSRNVIDLIAF